MAYYDGGGTTKAVYGRTYERLGHTTAAGPLYEMPDPWGSPLYTVDAQGNATWRTGHDAWGRVETQITFLGVSLKDEQERKKLCYHMSGYFRCCLFFTIWKK